MALFPGNTADILSSALNALELAVTLLYSSSAPQHRQRMAIGRRGDPGRCDQILTERNHDPNEIKEEEIAPVIISLWPTVRQTLVVLVKQRGSIIKDVTIELAERHDCLKGMSKRVGAHDEPGNNERKRTPTDLKGS